MQRGELRRYWLRIVRDYPELYVHSVKRSSNLYVMERRLEIEKLKTNTNRKSLSCLLELDGPGWAVLREPGGKRVALVHGTASLLSSLIRVRRDLTHDVGLWRVLMVGSYGGSGLPEIVALRGLLARLRESYEVVYPTRDPVSFTVEWGRCLSGRFLVYLRVARGTCYALALFEKGGEAASWAKSKAEACVVANGHNDGLDLKLEGLSWLERMGSEVR